MRIAHNFCYGQEAGAGQARYDEAIHESAGLPFMQRKDGVRAIERAVVQIAHNLGRRDLGRQVARKLGKTVDLSHLLVVDAIDDQSAENGVPPTIGDIARYLDVHHSRASRMVKGAIRATLATRLASQADGRKSCVELSDRGREIAAAIRDARARYFAVRMKDWPNADRREFARLLIQFARSDHLRRGDQGDGGVSVSESPSAQAGTIDDLLGNSQGPAAMPAVESKRQRRRKKQEATAVRRRRIVSSE
ncbi:MAG TPA: MarR family transcriptional regulator [Rhizomicrobium sp.]|jgi:DNA-binding MarR family transcriptional regulator|nr:MarR family transcriptional regulator [Rhizomicrobium sp.]